MSDLTYPTVLVPIVERHFEELDLLWEQREHALHLPDWTLGELRELEERARLQLEGLLVGRGHAVDLALAALDGDEFGAACAAGWVLAAYPDVAARPALLAAGLERVVANESEEVRDGFGRALRQTDLASLHEPLAALARGDDPMLAALAAGALAFHGLPVEGLERLLEQDSLGARVQVLDALGRLGELREREAFERALARADESGEPELARAAWRAAALSALPGLEAVCRAAAAEGGVAGDTALELLGAFGDADDRSLLLDALGAEGARALAALRGLGRLGDPTTLDALAGAMARPELALAAAAAFTRLTGKPLEAFAADPGEPPPIDDDDVDAAFDWDDERPDAERARALIASVPSEAPRLQGGRPIDELDFDGQGTTLELRHDLALVARARAITDERVLRLERAGWLG